MHVVCSPDLPVMVDAGVAIRVAWDLALVLGRAKIGSGAVFISLDLEILRLAAAAFVESFGS